MLVLPATVTHSCALAIAQAMKAGVGAQTAGVVMDASGLSRFDSSALAVMLACSREAAAVGKSFAVQGLPIKLGQLANLYGVAALIPAAA